MTPRKPVAFDIAAGDVTVVRPGETPPPAARVVIEESEELEPPPPPPQRRGFSWGRLFFGAAGGLIVLGVGLAVDDLVRSLFARQDWLGWLALGLVGVAGLALFAIVVREVAGLMWLARVDRTRTAAEAAVARDDGAAAERIVGSLVKAYADRADLAAARAAAASHDGEVIDGGDRLRLAEAELMTPLDEAAARLVSEAARRVSVVTAISPRALVDLLFVLAAALALIRRIAALYGGRPGIVGLARLARLVVAHLAVTGSIAIGDGIAQQIVGHGLAARLSARLGEGMVNGMLTARVGLAAIDVCRPLPFLARRRPGVSEVMAAVLGKGGGDAD